MSNVTNASSSVFHAMRECISWKLGRPSGSGAIISPSMMKDFAGSFSTAPMTGR
jgi:hypothetical protein